MPNPIIGAIGSTVGGLLQSRAQSRAAETAGAAQTAAANQQIEEARRQFDTVRTLLDPYVNSGNVALRGAMDLLGYGGSALSQPQEITTIPGVAASGGGVDRAALERARAQRQRGPRFERAYQDLLAKSRVPGVAGSPTMFQVGGQTFATMEEAQAAAARGAGPSVSPQQAQADAIERVKSGSQFTELTRQGEEAILANAAATGGLRGGNVQGLLAQYRPAMLQQLIDKQLTALGGLAANGQGAAGGLGTAALQTGQTVGGAMGEVGQAQAGTALAQGRAGSNFFGGLGVAAGDLAGSWSQRPANAGLFDKWGF